MVRATCSHNDPRYRQSVKFFPERTRKAFGRRELRGIDSVKRLSSLLDIARKYLSPESPDKPDHRKTRDPARPRQNQHPNREAEGFGW